MLPNSRQTIHMGINFVFSPVPLVDAQIRIQFQQALLDQGFEFSAVQGQGGDPITVVRESPRLEVKMGPIGPPAVGQLLIISPTQTLHSDLFIREAEAVVRAFEQTWPASERQMLSCDATFRDLYESSAKHAFQELWESRLNLSTSTLAALGRQVLGGGLRFVMPPQQTDEQPVTVEVKVESFLRDTKKIFVETQFAWAGPMAPHTLMDPASRLEQVDRYVENNVEPFLTGRIHDDNDQ